MFKCKTGCKVDTRDKCMYLLPCVKYSVRHPEIQDCLEQVCCTGTCGETYNANHWLLNPMDQVSFYFPLPFQSVYTLHTVYSTIGFVQQWC